MAQTNESKEIKKTKVTMHTGYFLMQGGSKIDFEEPEYELPDKLTLDLYGNSEWNFDDNDTICITDTDGTILQIPVKKIIAVSMSSYETEGE